MNKNINLCEILKDCPKGTKLYCPLYGEVELQEVSNPVFSYYPIKVIAYHYTKEYPNGYPVSKMFTLDGKYSSYHKNDECVLFPSKDQRDWSKWKCPKPKFDPNTLKPFDKVLSYYVCFGKGEWMCRYFSHFKNDMCYLTNGTYTNHCIPYNDETKHLVGTSDKAPEYYRYWNN